MVTHDFASVKLDCNSAGWRSCAFPETERLIKKDLGLQNRDQQSCSSEEEICEEEDSCKCCFLCLRECGRHVGRHYDGGHDLSEEMSYLLHQLDCIASDNLLIVLLAGAMLMIDTGQYKQHVRS